MGRLSTPDASRWDISGKLLAFMMFCIMSGLLPFFSYFSRASTWAIWGGIAALAAWKSRNGRWRRNIMPLLPYWLWLAFYLLWSLIVANFAGAALGVKIFLTTILLGLAVAGIASSRPSIASLSNGLQLAVLVNVLVAVLVTVSPAADRIFTLVTGHHAAYELGPGRYGGLWGNPNMGGYICLVATIFSVFATPLVAWIGRLSCLPILYLAASRKAATLYVFILVLYMLYSKRERFKLWMTLGLLALFLALGLMVDQGLQRESAQLASNATITRLMDLRENAETSRGINTRMDLLEEYYKVASREPWYGYGFMAMAGDQYDEKDKNLLVRKGLFEWGAHNTYAGLWIDAGPIAAIAFYLLMLHYARANLAFQGDPSTRWALAALTVVNLVIIFYSHNHLFDFGGQVAFLLMFYLPYSPGLRPERPAQAVATGRGGRIPALYPGPMGG